MPTYVYACRNCDDRIEVFQRITDEPLTDCPTCSGSLRRVLFPPAVLYRGSGFYTTDYKNGGRKENGAPEAKESGAPNAEASKETPAGAAGAAGDAAPGT